MFGLRICLIIALVAGATPIATAVDYTVPAGVTILTKEQLLTQVIGNTFIVGTSYVEYFEPPTGDLNKGRIKGHWKVHGLYNASWTINGAQMCWQFERADWNSADGGCFTTALDGDTVTRYKPNGEVKYERGHIIKLAPGNTKNL
jgi:hypothetical protein